MLSTFTGFEASHLLNVTMVKVDREGKVIDLDKFNIDGRAAASYLPSHDSVVFKEQHRKSIFESQSGGMKKELKAELRRRNNCSQYLILDDDGLSLKHKEISISFWFWFDPEEELHGGKRNFRTLLQGHIKVGGLLVITRSRRS